METAPPVALERDSAASSAMPVDKCTATAGIVNDASVPLIKMSELS
jgi:hypothetical protein